MWFLKNNCVLMVWYYGMHHRGIVADTSSSNDVKTIWGFVCLIIADDPADAHKFAVALSKCWPAMGVAGNFGVLLFRPSIVLAYPGRMLPVWHEANLADCTKAGLNQIQRLQIHHHMPKCTAKQHKDDTMCRIAMRGALSWWVPLRLTIQSHLLETVRLSLHIPTFWWQLQNCKHHWYPMEIIENQWRIVIYIYIYIALLKTMIFKTVPCWRTHGKDYAGDKCQVPCSTGIAMAPPRFKAWYRERNTKWGSPESHQHGIFNTTTSRPLGFQVEIQINLKNYTPFCDNLFKFHVGCFRLQFLITLGPCWVPCTAADLPPRKWQAGRHSGAYKASRWADWEPDAWLMNMFGSTIGSIIHQNLTGYGIVSVFQRWLVEMTRIFLRIGWTVRYGHIFFYHQPVINLPLDGMRYLWKMDRQMQVMDGISH